MKKSGWIIATFLCILCFSCQVSAATQGRCGEEATFLLDSEGTLYIRGKGKVGDYLFAQNIGADRIKKIIINEGITELEYGFAGCDRVESVQIPSSLIRMEESAFSGCDHLKEFVVAEDNPAYAGDSTGLYSKDRSQLFYAVEGDSDHYTVPEGVRSLGVWAFANFTKVRKITISKDLVEVHASFLNLNQLVEIDVPPDNPEYKSEEGVLFDRKEKKLLVCPPGKKGDYVIPEDTSSIGEGAFFFCKELTKIVIPDTVETIGGSAFSECSGLTHLALPSAMEELPWNLCSGCSSLVSVTLPKKLQTIPSWAFCGCRALNHIDLPDSVTSIGYRAFSEAGLTEIDIPEGITCLEEETFWDCKNLKKITLPDNLSRINDSAFYGCKSLEIMDLPDSVTYIGKDAFAKCNRVRRFRIPNSLEHLGEGPLFGKELQEIIVDNNPAYCLVDGALMTADHTYLIRTAGRKDGKYTIDKEVTLISAYAFAGYNISSLEIPISVKRLTADRLVYESEQGLEVFYEGTVKQWNAIKGTIYADVIHYNYQNASENPSGNLLDSQQNYIRQTWSFSPPESLVSRDALALDYGSVLASAISENLIGEKKRNMCFSMTALAGAYRLSQDTEPLSFKNPVSGYKTSALYEVKDHGWIDENSDQTVFQMMMTAQSHMYSPELQKEIKEHSTELRSVNNLEELDGGECCFILTDSGKQSRILIPLYVKSKGYKPLTEAHSKIRIKVYDSNDPGSLHDLLIELQMNEKTIEDWVYTAGQCQCTKKNGSLFLASNMRTFFSMITREKREGLTDYDHLLCVSDPAMKITTQYGASTLKNPGQGLLPIQNLSGDSDLNLGFWSSCGNSVKIQGDNRSRSCSYVSGHSGIHASIPPGGLAAMTVAEDGFDSASFQLIKDDDPVTATYFNDRTETGLNRISIRGNGSKKMMTKEKEGSIQISGFEWLTVSIGEEDPEVLEYHINPGATYEIRGSQLWRTDQERVIRTIDDGGDDSPALKAIKVSNIRLSGLSHKVARGKRIQIHVKVLPATAKNRSLKWVSTNTKVATVNRNGMVKIKKNAGGKKVVIRALAVDGSGKKAEWKLSVMKGVIKSIKIVKGKKTLKAGKTMKLKAKVKASKGANKEILWSSSNNKYAVVNARGLVKAKKKGRGKTVTISAWAMDGSGKKGVWKIRIR